jgi:hypothetical protein
MKHSIEPENFRLAEQCYNEMPRQALLGNINTKRYRLWQLRRCIHCITLKCAQLRENLTALRQLQYSCEGKANPISRPEGIRL